MVSFLDDLHSILTFPQTEADRAHNLNLIAEVRATWFRIVLEKLPQHDLARMTERPQINAKAKAGAKAKASAKAKALAKAKANAKSAPMAKAVPKNKVKAMAKSAA